MLSNYKIKAEKFIPHVNVNIIGETLIISPVECKVEIVPGFCCERNCIVVSCSFCNITVTVPLGGDINFYSPQNSPKYSDFIKRITDSHFHPEIDSLMYIKEDYVILSKAPKVYVLGSCDDVICSYCGMAIVRTDYMGGTITVDEIFYYLNYHYKDSNCCIKKHNFAHERMNESRMFHREITKLLGALEKRERNKRHPNKELHDCVVPVIGKCECGENDMVECRICGNKVKVVNGIKKCYIQSVMSHLGKYVKGNHTDLINHVNDDTLCAICGESYDAPANEIDKNYVMSHFIKCADKNKEHVKEIGLLCKN